MATYTYEVITTGQQIEVTQSIKEPAHTVLEIDGELRTVRRLIAGSTSFHLKGGRWAKQGYS